MSFLESKCCWSLEISASETMAVFFAGMGRSARSSGAVTANEGREATEIVTETAKKKKIFDIMTSLRRSE